MADSSTGGLTSFLFQGQPPIPVPTGSDTSTNFPLWLQTGIYDIANAGMNLAQQPFTPFPGQQVATPSVDTESAWNLAQSNVGNYSGALNQAQALTSQASTPITGQDISNFENPYNQQVVGALQQAANTNLTQNVLPGIQDQFVGSGQAASPQQMEMTNRALYNEQAALNPAVSQALQTGYSGALSAAQQQKQMEQTTGAQMGQLGVEQSQLGSYDVANLAAAGNAQDTLAQTNINAAINNFNQQQQYPYQQLSFVSDMLRGLQVPTTSQTASQTFPSAVGASPVATGLGTAALASSLGVAAAKGGHIRTRGALSYADGGEVEDTSDLFSDPGKSWQQMKDAANGLYRTTKDVLRGDEPQYNADLRHVQQKNHVPTPRMIHPTDEDAYGNPRYRHGGALGYAAGGEVLGRTAGAGNYGTAPLESAPDWMSALQRNRRGVEPDDENDARDEAEVEAIRRGLTATQVNRRGAANMNHGGALSYADGGDVYHDDGGTWLDHLDRMRPSSQDETVRYDMEPGALMQAIAAQRLQQQQNLPVADGAFPGGDFRYLVPGSIAALRRRQQVSTPRDPSAPTTFQPETDYSGALGMYARGGRMRRAA